ncbi:uncharacterized protein LAESUDRAFT_700298 [Laetiporus sulphureus 93-53]|uniref:DUF6593 domain-containing protein n=1 Tax=Laetiporus sulphureus 93-53 TaxID=1314785 RepID=A0A165E8N8_9APHY|nr:uncharacterized protein LAESUDRAFT_700298 [Laetiporus sulphureus 93-53]KZT06476.1 hypothetical protein LAESUDRAFT_700298 [Laetiporus sulphureus 93-53]
MTASHVLLQFSADPWNARFEDSERRKAFTVIMVEEDPNLIMRLTLEDEWSKQHNDIMGPNRSYFYFGPSRAPGFLVYGNGSPLSMDKVLRRKKEASSSRYFTAQNGRELKWKIAPERYECVDSKGTTVALWERSRLQDEFHARLTVTQSGLSIITELLTTLTLNRIASIMNW